MPWEKVTKKEWGTRKYTAPVVRLVWYKVKKAKHPVASFNFSSRAKKELGYEGEKFCDIYKDGTKFLFKFRKEEGESSRKVNQPKGINISVRLYKTILDPVTPGNNLTFLLQIKEPLSGVIDLSKPVNPKDYLEQEPYKTD